MDKKLVSPNLNEGLVKKYVPVEEWTVSNGRSWLLSEKMEENGFHDPENQFSLVKV